MINSIEDLRSAGVLPTGPVSAWPQHRNNAGIAAHPPGKVLKDTTVKASGMQMIAGLARTAGQAITNGHVSKEIREERYDTCKACPHLIEESKRCSECGCYMEAKTWIAGDPNMLCPKKKWKR